MIRKIFQLLPFDLRTKKFLKFAYFKTAAMFGVEQFPALNGLDRKMLPYLPQRGGVFIEVGANDGVSQSNTWFLETYRDWRGLLIEPLPDLAALAKKFRKTPVANVALGSMEADGSSLDLISSDLVTKVDSGASAGSGKRVTVPVRALSRLLDEHGIMAVDFFSLDVEGYELPVLQGIDFNRHLPQFILVETSKFDEVSAFLQDRYELREKLSYHDYLFQARSPIRQS
jgi:FkbM family methyltransferase